MVKTVKTILAIIIISSCFTDRPKQEIDPAWTYQGCIKLHSTSYQHLFKDSLCNEYPIFTKSKDFKIKINYE